MQNLSTGFKTLSSYKGRSLTIIIILSILLGIITGLNLAARGLENSLLSASASSTGGEVYLETRCERTNSSTCASRLESLVSAHHGAILGDLSFYQIPNYGSLSVVSASAAQPFLSNSSASLSTEKLPVLATPTADLPSDFIAVGEYPAVSSPVSSEGFHFTNSLLASISSYYPSFMLIDNDSEDVKSYLADTTASVAPVISQIVSFESFADAKSYLLAAQSAPDVYSEIITDDLFSNTSAIITAFHPIQITLNILTAAVIIIAIFVVALLLSSVIKSSKPSRDSASKYVSYTLVVNLCLLLGTGFFAALTILTISIVDGNALTESIKAMYNLSQAPHISFFALSCNFWCLLAALILLTPVSLLLNCDKLRKGTIKPTKNSKSAR